MSEMKKPDLRFGSAYASALYIGTNTVKEVEEQR